MASQRDKERVTRTIVECSKASKANLRFALRQVTQLAIRLGVRGGTEEDRAYILGVQGAADIAGWTAFEPTNNKVLD